MCLFGFSSVLYVFFFLLSSTVVRVSKCGRYRRSRGVTADKRASFAWHMCSVLICLCECLLIGYVTCNVVRMYVESARVCSRRGAFSFLYAVHMNSAVTLRSGKAGRRRRLCFLFRG